MILRLNTPPIQCFFSFCFSDWYEMYLYVYYDCICVGTCMCIHAYVSTCMWNLGVDIKSSLILLIMLVTKTGSLNWTQSTYKLSFTSKLALEISGLFSKVWNYRQCILITWHLNELGSSELWLLYFLYRYFLHWDIYQHHCLYCLYLLCCLAAN